MHFALDKMIADKMVGWCIPEIDERNFVQSVSLSFSGFLTRLFRRVFIEKLNLRSFLNRNMIIIDPERRIVLHNRLVIGFLRLPLANLKLRLSID